MAVFPVPKYISKLQMVLLEWRSFAQQQPVTEPKQDWEPNRCVALHMFRGDGPFPCHVLELKTLLFNLLDDPAFRDMTRALRSTVTSLPFQAE